MHPPCTHGALTVHTVHSPSTHRALTVQVVAAGGLPREDTMAVTPGGSGDRSYGDARFVNAAGNHAAPPGRPSLAAAVNAPAIAAAAAAEAAARAAAGGKPAAGVGWGVDLAPAPLVLGPEMTPHNVHILYVYAHVPHNVRYCVPLLLRAPAHAPTAQSVPLLCADSLCPLCAQYVPAQPTLCPPCAHPVPSLCSLCAHSAHSVPALPTLCPLCPPCAHGP